MKFGIDIYGDERMNPDDFSDPLIFPLAPPAAQSFHLTSARWISTNFLYRDSCFPDIFTTSGWMLYSSHRDVTHWFDDLSLAFWPSPSWTFGNQWSRPLLAIRNQAGLTHFHIVSVFEASL